MTKGFQNIAIIGAGAWGTALAQVFSEAGRAVILYARDRALADTIQKTRRNEEYLPGVALNEGICVTHSPEQASAKADILLLATPTQFVRTALALLYPHLPKNIPLVSCAKGIEISSGKLLSEVAAELAPEHPYAVLSGPTFAGEVASGLPTAVTLATAAPMERALLWAQALSSATFRPYVSTDPVGAEIAGALKNVVAIACGIVEGKGLGQNAKAAVMTRGMAEIRRLGIEKGAQAETFLGLSGLGDLTLTCHSMNSRNYSFGFELGRGRAVEDILAQRRTVTEGITTTKAATALARAVKINMPICNAVNQILHHRADVDAIVKELLARHLKPEND